MSLTLLAAACSNPAVDGPAAPVARHLEFTTPIGELTVGRSDKLLLTWSDGAAFTGPARWRAIPNDVLTVDESGVLTAIRMGTAVVVAESAGQTATLILEVKPDPMRPVRDNLSGTWKGSIKILDCNRISGEGSSACRFLKSADMPIAIALRQQRGALQGELEFARARGRLTGLRDMVGQMSVGAVLTRTEPGHRIEITRWDVKALAPANTMTGSIEWVEISVNHWGRQVYRFVAQVVELKRWNWTAE